MLAAVVAPVQVLRPVALAAVALVLMTQSVLMEHLAQLIQAAVVAVLGLLQHRAPAVQVL
jgi:hypothetical protein